MTLFLFSSTSIIDGLSTKVDALSSQLSQVIGELNATAATEQAAANMIQEIANKLANTAPDDTAQITALTVQLKKATDSLTAAMAGV